MDEIDLGMYLKTRLGMDEGAEIDPHPHWRDHLFDMAIEDKARQVTYLILIKPRATVEALALINLYNDYANASSEDENRSEPRFVLVTKYLPPHLDELAKRMDIFVLTVPRGVKLTEQSERSVHAPMKVTSEKSWKVVSGLIRIKTSSIRNLSLTQGVSYGWTHSTITDLIAHGIAKRNGNQVSIVDIDKLLNGVAWERPTQTLVVKELTILGKNLFEVARELTAIFDGENVPHAFACYMAGTQYMGQSVRFDSLQVYIDKDDMNEALGRLSPRTEGPGIRIQVMAPDREMFSGAQIIGGIRVTSPSQTLLDLAGLGYKGRDMTKAMVTALDKL